jgi:GNAT superfamily N-acetyltransferase
MDNDLIKTPIPNFTLRAAAAGDVPLILSFIRELAEYEKLSSEVVATEELLKKNLFGERNSAEVIIGEYQNKPVSFALFFHNFSTFLGKPGIYLEDLYVSPSMRGTGIGKVMLSYIAKLALERGCGRLEWSVLDWNEPALKFYRSIDAVPMEDWTMQRITAEALSSLAGKFADKN